MRLVCIEDLCRFGPTAARTAAADRLLLRYAVVIEPVLRLASPKDRKGFYIRQRHGAIGTTKRRSEIAPLHVRPRMKVWIGSWV